MNDEFSTHLLVKNETLGETMPEAVCIALTNSARRLSEAFMREGHETLAAVHEYMFKTAPNMLSWYTLDANGYLNVVFLVGQTTSYELALLHQKVEEELCGETVVFTSPIIGTGLTQEGVKYDA